MNLEEFDNKLAEAFRNENLPPKDKLWENIASNIDKPSKSPIWWWAIPSLIILAVAITFNSINKAADKSISNNNQEITNTTVNSTPNTIPNQSIEISDDKNLSSKQPSSIKDNTSITSNTASPVDKNNSKNKSKFQKSNKVNNVNVSNSYSSSTNNQIKNIPLNTSNFFEDENFNFFGFPYRKLVTKSFVFEELSAIDVPSIPKKIKKPNDIVFINKKNKIVDFNKKWWFSYGIGPNLSINTLNIDDSKEKFVHKDLWEDKETLTRNGSGLNAFTHLSYNFKPLLSFETGLSYVMRVEPIRLSDESLDIPVRDINTNEITGYNKIIIYLLEKNQTTGLYDTIGSYQLASAHNLAVNNRYNAFTIPLTFNKEFVLSSNTKIKLGAGTGITYLYSNKSTYLDYISTSKVEFKKKSMINASLNANLGFYTNFNNVGEIGIYTGYNYYAMPWDLPNKQYSLKMSDLNFGVSFRRPLNWGK